MESGLAAEHIPVLAAYIFNSTLPGLGAFCQMKTKQLWRACYTKYIKPAAHAAAIPKNHLTMFKLWRFLTLPSTAGR